MTTFAVLRIVDGKVCCMKNNYQLHYYGTARTNILQSLQSPHISNFKIVSLQKKKKKQPTISDFTRSSGGGLLGVAIQNK